MAKYGKSMQRSVKRAMHKLKEGSLKSGRNGKWVTSRKQAVAIGLSEARRKGAKAPANRYRTLQELAVRNHCVSGLWSDFLH